MITLAEVDTLAVTGVGRVMHLAKRRIIDFGPPDADTICGRRLYEVYDYDLADEDSLPWDLCRSCAKKRREQVD